MQLKRTLTEGQFWQAQVGEPKAAGGGGETTRLGHPPPPSGNKHLKTLFLEHTRQAVYDSNAPSHRQYPLPGTSRQTTKPTQDSPTDTE